MVYHGMWYTYDGIPWYITVRPMCYDTVVYIVYHAYNTL